MTRIITWAPSGDTREVIRSYGPAVDRRLEEVTRSFQRILGSSFRVQLDYQSNAKSFGAVCELRGVDQYSEPDAQQQVEDALNAAWNHCQQRWERAATRDFHRAKRRTH